MVVLFESKGRFHHGSITRPVVRAAAFALLCGAGFIVSSFPADSQTERPDVSILSTEAMPNQRDAQGTRAISTPALLVHALHSLNPQENRQNAQDEASYRESQTGAATRGIRLGHATAVNDQDIGHDYALIVAGDNYQYWTPLFNPSIDGTTLKNELVQNYHFVDARWVHDPTKLDLTHALQELLAMKPQQEDRLLIYIAGHGHLDTNWNRGYLVVNDTKSPLNDPTFNTFFSFLELASDVDSLPFEPVLIVFDVCHGGSFGGGSFDIHERPTHIDTTNVENPAPEAELVHRKMEVRSRYYITSGGVRDSVSDGAAGEHSPFARTFLKILRGYGGNDHLIDLGGLIGQIDGMTPEPYSGTFGSAKGGDYVLVPVANPKKTEDPSLK